MEWNEVSGLKVTDGLFKDVSYYIIGNVHESVDIFLKDGGGKKHSYLSEMISHVIAGNDENDEVSVAKELFQLPVVTDLWVLRSVQCSHILPTQIFDPDAGSKVFVGVVVCPSQLSAMDNKIVWSLVTCYGGSHQLVLNKRVTHLVTTKAEGAKYDRAYGNDENSSIKIVTPDWVLESVRLKMRVEERPYHPRLILPPMTQPANISTVHEGVASLCLATAQEQTSDAASSAPASNKLTSKKLCQPNSAVGNIEMCNLPARSVSNTNMRSHLKNIANQNEAVAKTPRNRTGNSAKSSRSNSNATILATQQIPTTQRNALVGSNKLLAESYCSHDAAELVPPDICLLGCIFYVADYQKCIEHSALEMWKQVILQFGGQVDDSYSNRITHVLCEHQKSDVFSLALRDGKRLVTAHWLNDCLSARMMEVPSEALHFPYVFGRERPGSNQLISVTNFGGDERYRVKKMIAQFGAQFTGYLTRANSILIAKHAGGAKFMKALEWGIPVVGINWLNDVILGDLNALKLPIQPRYYLRDNHSSPCSGNIFHIDTSKVSHLLEGWKTAVKISKETWKKFQSSKMATLSKENVVISSRLTSIENSAPLVNKQWPLEDGCSPEKRFRFPDGNCSQTMPVIIMTGFDEDQVARLTKIVHSLGGQLAQSVQPGCTHLIANSIKRTVKFLLAFGVVRHVVTSDWLVQSSAANRFLDENSFKLRDENMETSFNFSLQTSLCRAQERPLFENLSFYFTPSVEPSKALLSEIVKSVGGKVIRKLPPLKQLIKLVNKQNEPTVIIISCDADFYLLRDVHARQIGIHNAEFVLTGVMRQQVDFSAFRMNS